MRKYLLTVLYLLPLTILAQTPLGFDCTNPPLSADCGDLNPSGGLAPGSPTVFCEGEVVNFVNTTPANTIDSTIYCWGDGSYTIVRGVTGASHIYSFPRDTCLPSNRNISVIVRMIVFKRCGEDVSINWIATPISIRVKPKVLFTASDSIGCLGDRFNFTNNTCSNSPSAIYTWHFGNGDSIRSTSTNVQHVFNQTGRHIVRLVVNNGCGNIESNSLIEVRDTPSVSYGVITNNNGNCIPFDVSFRSSSTNIDTYSWAITGGSGATYINNTTRYSQNPTIRFTELGTYNIRLSGVGCRSTNWDTTITTNMQPKVTLANINDSCTSVTFDPSRIVSYSGGDATAYNWTFVGGSPPASNQRYPSAQRFTQAGQYSVRIEASNVCGIGRDTVNFAVTPVPKVNVGVSNITSCIPFDINFTNTSPQTGGFQWTISGGTGYSFLNNTNINSPNPNIRFSSLGTYRIQGITQNCATFQFDTLITTNTLPQVALARVSDSCQSATIDPSRIVTYSGGTPSLYQWTFAGGTPPFSNMRTPSVQNYNQPGQYSIKVEVSNVCGAAKDSFGFRVMSLEALRLTPVPPLCNTNQPVRLAATPTGGTWIGKGVSSSGFFYPANADLGQNTVTYSYGTGRCAVSTNMQIMVGGANINPGADVSICADAPAFNLTGHSPTGGKWSGVGIVDSINGIFNPSVSGIGRRILTYTYTDPVSRCVNTSSRIVNINALPQAIIDNLPNACVGISLPFRNLSQNIATANWSFGDGTTSSAINATHIYNAAGSYNVNLTVQNSFGCTHSTSKNILIDKQGLAEFTKSTNGGCGDLLSATFYNIGKTYCHR